MVPKRRTGAGRAASLCQLNKVLGLGEISPTDVPNLLPFQMSDTGTLRSSVVFMNEDHANRNRWAISVAFALLLHGAIAGAVLNWHNLLNPARLGDPFIIDLLPLPDASAPPPSESQPASLVNNDEILPSASERVVTNAPDATAPGIIAVSRGDGQDNSTENTVGAGGGASYVAPNNGRAGGQPEASYPASSLPITSAPTISVPLIVAAPASAPATIAPTSSAPATGHPTTGVPIVSAPTAVAPTAGHPSTSYPATSMENSPIDASMAPSSHSNKTATGIAQSKRIVLLRPSKLASQFQHARNSSMAHGPATTTNAVGAHVQDRVRAALARGTISAAARSGIGSGVMAPGMVGGGTGSSDGVTKNAIGATVPIHPGLTNAGASKIGPTTSPNAAVGSAGLMTNRSALNGQTMVHPGSGTTVLGGPTQIRQTNLNTGVLSGNMFHPRHQ